MNCRKWDDADWDALLYTIEGDKCVLFLGPDVTEGAGDQGRGSLGSELCSLLFSEMENSGDAQLKDELGCIDTTNLSHVAQLYRRYKGGDSYLSSTVQRFYRERQDQTSPLYENLARLPFSFIVSTTLDTMLETAFSANNKQAQVSWYNFARPSRSSTSAGTPLQPHVFHLCGHLQDPDSMVLTEDDLLNFLIAIASKDPPLPRTITEVFSDASTSILFLGFGFRYWYLRILLQSLQRNGSLKESSLLAFEPCSFEENSEVQRAVLFFRERSRNIRIYCLDLNDFVKELLRRHEARPDAGDGADVQPRDVPAANAPRVFICHAHEDRQEAQALTRALETAGIRPWIDRQDLRGGDRWDSLIEETINNEIDYFILFQTPALNAKRNIISYVNKEIDVAGEKQRWAGRSTFIVPVVAKGGPALSEFNTLQSIDIDGEGGMQQLFSAIRRDFERRRKGMAAVAMSRGAAA